MKSLLVDLFQRMNHHPTRNDDEVAPVAEVVAPSCHEDVNRAQEEEKKNDEVVQEFVPPQSCCSSGIETNDSNNNNNNNKRLVCFDCNKPVNKIKTCSQCKIAVYCSNKCQAQAWKKGHKQTCPLLLQATNESKMVTTSTTASERIVFVTQQDWHDYGYMTTTGMQKVHGLPELLAVDIAVPGESWLQVHHCLGTVKQQLIMAQQGSGAKHKALTQAETILRLPPPPPPPPPGVVEPGENANEYIDQVAVLLVTDTTAVQKLTETFFTPYNNSNGDSNGDETTPTKMDRLFLLMPVTSGGRQWGQIPPAPEGKVALRNKIKGEFEKQGLGLAGFVRMLDGNRDNCAADNLRLVSLPDALQHTEWCVYWGMKLDTTEAAYLRQYQASHFADLCMGGFGRRSGQEYIRQVVFACENVHDNYKNGTKIADKTASSVIT